MTKILNFSVNEISGRTFEMPYDKAISFIKENCQNEDIDFNNITEYELADLLWKYHSNLEKYELQNDTFQSEIHETKIYETTIQVA